MNGVCGKELTTAWSHRCRLPWGHEGPCRCCGSLDALTAAREEHVRAIQTYATHHAQWAAGEQDVDTTPAWHEVLRTHDAVCTAARAEGWDAHRDAVQPMIDRGLAAANEHAEGYRRGLAASETLVTDLRKRVNDVFRWYDLVRPRAKP